MTIPAARGSAQWWDQRYAAIDLMWSVGPNRFVVEEVEPLAAGTALDLACGEGRNAIWLAERGWTTTGVDFSAVAIERARTISRERGAEVTWVQADALTWRGEHRFDLVLLAYLQLRQLERIAAITTAAAATRAGGSLLVIGHDRRNLAEGTGGPQDPALLWSPEEVAIPGFDILRSETAPRPTDDGIAQDTVVHLRHRTR
jgi:SAM-dependent methyltransferase